MADDNTGENQNQDNSQNQDGNQNNNTDEGKKDDMVTIPRNRFDALNSEIKELGGKLKSIEKEKIESDAKKKAEAGEFEKLYNEANSKAQSLESELEKLTGGLKAYDDYANEVLNDLKKSIPKEEQGIFNDLEGLPLPQQMRLARTLASKVSGSKITINGDIGGSNTGKKTPDGMQDKIEAYKSAKLRGNPEAMYTAKNAILESDKDFDFSSIN